MRVIAGHLKGRRLRAPRGYGVRPTSDKVKGALFNIVGERIAGARVLDLFAGTGGVGIEALSRGAAHVLFVEDDPDAKAVLSANLAACGLSKPQAETWARGGVSSLLSHLKRHHVDPYDFVFADPPYRHAPATRLLRPFLGGLALKPDGWLVIEHHRFDAPTAPEGSMTHIRDCRYGETVLTFYRRTDGVQ